MSRHFFASLTQNPISLTGTALAVTSVTLMIALFTFELLGYEGSPYIGLITYLILPVFFVTGLILIPIGILRQRKRAARAAAAGEAPPIFPIIDLNTENTRKAVIIFMVLTMLNIVVVAGATYKAVDFMDSTAFCGTVCHAVMQPEHTAHMRSPHARVRCVDCHVGPGADWFVKSKLDGAWQAVAVTLNIYPRPISTPLEHLRPSVGTCEQCHWPTVFVGDKLKIETVYDEDEHNTELKNAILLKVGGLKGRESHGIHWHMDPGVEIRFRSDKSRMTIYDVELTQPDGTVKLFQVGETPEDATDWRLMDCVDCHNRPTHLYRHPGEELDFLLAAGKINTSLPYIKREGVRIIEEAEYETHDEARIGLAESLHAFYRENYPDVLVQNAVAVAEAADLLGDIYSWNVFPHMRVNWDTYPDHSAHPPIRSRENAPGCFRCHNRDHQTADGERISRSCDLCHTVLATREQDPEILKLLNP
jgi:hypothetical protein